MTVSASPFGRAAKIPCTRRRTAGDSAPGRPRVLRTSQNTSRCGRYRGPTRPARAPQRQAERHGEWQPPRPEVAASVSIEAAPCWFQAIRTLSTTGTAPNLIRQTSRRADAAAAGRPVRSRGMSVLRDYAARIAEKDHLRAELRQDALALPLIVVDPMVGEHVRTMHGSPSRGGRGASATAGRGWARGGARRRTSSRPCRTSWWRCRRAARCG